MEILQDKEQKRFYTVQDGFTGYAEYVEDGRSFDILHTIVPKEIGGRGIASALVGAAYSYAEQKGLEKKASCSYAAKWLERHRG